MPYSAYNSTNTSYALNKTLATMAWNQTNTTYPAINTTGWLNQFGYNGSVVQSQNISVSTSFTVGTASTGLASVAHTIPATPLANLYVGQFADDNVIAGISASKRADINDNNIYGIKGASLTSTGTATSASGYEVVGGLFAGQDGHTSGAVGTTAALKGTSTFVPNGVGSPNTYRVYGMDFAAYTRALGGSTPLTDLVAGANFEYGSYPSTGNGTISQASGIRLDLDTGNAGSKITSGYGIDVLMPNGKGNVTTYTGIGVTRQTFTGNTTTFYGINIGDYTIPAYSTGSSSYAMYLSKQTGATNNWQLYSLGGNSFLDNGNLTIIGNTNQTGNINTTGNLTGSNMYGGMFNYTDGGYIFTIGSSATYYNLSNQQAGLTNGFVVATGTTKSCLAAQYAGVYQIIGSLSAKQQTGTGSLYGFGMALINSSGYFDPEQVARCYTRFDGLGSYGSNNFNCFIRLNAGDIIFPQIDDEANPSKDLNIMAMNFNAVRVGN